MTRLPLRNLLLLLMTSVLVLACGSRLPRPAAGPGAPTAAEAVDRFLRLAAAKSYLEMGWVFGTAGGPIIRRDPAPEVERRMYALATVLQNEVYVLGAGSPIPGRVGGAESLTARLRREGRTVDVPFTVVRGPDRRWFVEQVGIEAITNAK